MGLALIPLISAIVVSPWANDDTINKDFRANTLLEGKTLGSQIVYFTTIWMEVAGRFFPGSVSWTFTLFWNVQNRLAYKLILALLIFLALISLTLVVYLFSRSSRLAVLTYFLSIGTVSIRLGFDSITSFTGLLPLTTFLTCGALVFILSAKPPWAYFFGGLLYLVALLTYESVILFAPLFVILLWAKTKKWRRTLAILIPAALISIIVLALRAKTVVGNVPSAYSVNLDPVMVLATFGKQFSSAIPISQWIFQVPDRPYIQPIFILLALLFAGLPSFGALLLVTRDSTWATKKLVIALASSGLWIWLVSSVLTATTVRWQNELVWGAGYLNVLYEYFGFALTLSALIGALFMLSKKLIPLRFQWLTNASLAFGIALMITFTAAANLAIIPS